MLIALFNPLHDRPPYVRSYFIIFFLSTSQDEVKKITLYSSEERRSANFLLDTSQGLKQKSPKSLNVKRRLASFPLNTLWDFTRNMCYIRAKNGHILSIQVLIKDLFHTQITKLIDDQAFDSLTLLFMQIKKEH